MRISVAAPCLCFALAVAVGAGPAPDKKSDFEALLKQAHASMDAGRFKEAREVLLTKLGEHKDADYFKSAREAIRADLKQCSFRIAYPPKSLKDLLSGDVSSFDAKSGQATITYDRKAMGARKPPAKFPGGDVHDVSGESELAYPFAGPFTLVFKGSALTERCPLVRVCIREDESCLFELDRRGLTCFDLLKGTEVIGGASSTNMYNVQRPFTLKISVRDAQFEALLDGKRMIAADKPKGVFGPARFWGVPQLDKLEVNGKLDLEWLNGRIEERSKADLAEFEKSWDPQKELPEWAR